MKIDLKSSNKNRYFSTRFFNLSSKALPLPLYPALYLPLSPKAITFFLPSVPVRTPIGGKQRYFKETRVNGYGGDIGVRGTPLPYGSTLFQVQKQGNASLPEVEVGQGRGLTKTKIKFSETKNKKLKHKIHFLHAFWRLNIGNLDFSLSTQLLLKKLGINNVYSLHYFILKKSTHSLFSKGQQKEIINIYYKFGFNSPFIK